MKILFFDKKVFFHFLIFIWIFLTTSLIIPIFHQAYFLPKALCFLLIMFVFPFLSWSKQSIFFLIGSTFFLFNHTFSFSFFYWILYVNAFIFYQFLMQKPHFLSPCKGAIMLTGLIQSCVGIIQALFFKEVAIGTIGNPEFFATFLGISLLLFLEKKPEFYHHSSSQHFIGSFFSVTSSSFSKFLLSFLFILGIFFSQTKGTYLFFLGLGIVFLIKRTNTLHPYSLIKKILVLLLIISLFIFSLPQSVYMALWHSLKSRLCLFLVCFKQCQLWGVGIGKFGIIYTDTLYDLFIQFPKLQSLFATYSGIVSHAHQFILNSWVELGIVGLIVSLLMSFQLFSRSSWQNLTPLFLLFKLSYTVVLPSVSGFLLFAFVFAYSKTEDEAYQIKWFKEHVIRLKNFLNVFNGFFMKNRLNGFDVKKWPFYIFLTVSYFYFFSLCYADVLYKKGDQLLKENKPYQAIFLFQQALNFYPCHFYSNLKFAYSAYLLNKTPLSYQALEKGLCVEKSWPILNFKAVLLYYSGNIDEAKKEFIYLKTVFPEHEFPLIWLSKIENVPVQEFQKMQKRERKKIFFNEH